MVLVRAKEVECDSVGEGMSSMVVVTYKVDVWLLGLALMEAVLVSDEPSTLDDGVSENVVFTVTVLVHVRPSLLNEIEREFDFSPLGLAFDSSFVRLAEG